MPSSFRLDESPVQQPALCSQSPVALRPASITSDRSSVDEAVGGVPTSNRTGNVHAASYVTVSAILSRSEMYYPAGAEQGELLRGNFISSDGSLGGGYPRRQSFTNPTRGDSSRYSLRRRPSKKAPSNGSAVEALGALLLHRDSSGKVSNLSFTREDGTYSQARKPLVQTWNQALRELSRLRFGLQLPSGSGSRDDASRPRTEKGTIAERRARMWNRIHLSRSRDGSESPSDSGFRRVRSSRTGLTFEIGSQPFHERKSTILDRADYPVPEASSVSGSFTGARAFPEGELSLPGTIVLKAGERPRIRQSKSSDYGFGSSFNSEDLPEAPPSPIAMPGAWHGGSAWRSKPGDGFEEGALLLPPPLLDDQGSDPHSFEGLLGIRRMREQEKVRKQMERLKARNRPTHKVGPFTALVNFVKAAHAAETSARKAQNRQHRRPLLGSRSVSAPQNLPRTAERYVDPVLGPFTNHAGIDFFEGAEDDYDDDEKDPNEDKDDHDEGNSDEEEYEEEQQEDDDDDDQDGDTTEDLTFEARNSTNEDTDSTKTRQTSIEPTVGAGVSGETYDSAHPKTPLTTSPAFRAAKRRQAALSRKRSRVNSTDVATRQLNTVFESESSKSFALPTLDGMSPELPPLSSPYLRPTSRNSSSLSLRDMPAAPRLLPVQMSLPPSPFLPLSLDARSQSRERRSSNGSVVAGTDYWSARPLYSGTPQTPRLGPTVLSIPPSPWTPYQDAGGQHLYQLHVNTSTSSLRLPGTPRLIPTHLEILPSPFPTPSVSRRGSLLSAEPGLKAFAKEVEAGHRARAMSKSPLSNAIDAFKLDPVISPALTPSQERSGVLNAGETSAEAKRATRADQNGTAKRGRQRSASRREKKHLKERQANRLTPAHLFDDPLGSGTSTPTLSTPRQDGPPHVQLTPTQVDTFTESNAPSKEPVQKKAPSESEAVLIPASQQPRSFILWFLLGDIGLRSKTATDVDADLGVVAAVFVHLFQFVVFCTAHVVDLGFIWVENAALAFWFLRWLFLNITCQTVLAQCVVDAYRLIQGEWATVAEEDHEDRGMKRRGLKDASGKAKARGLTRWQVLRSLVELFCLHSVTRERYLAEGAGLVKLEGWSRRERMRGNASLLGAIGESGRLDIGAQKAAARAALEASSADRSGSEDERDDEDEDDSSTSDDEEMIVTNRGDDILEFSKTPRLDPMRPTSNRQTSGYFGTPYDATTSPQIKSSSSDAPSDIRALRESNKELVKTIKWASRLSISAYGLHVHIVDLPPTFTPSGERFSRQTFAYLSRLNADDVLHADIQTLDADADYSPTFYIVRDYVRRVVCVAVRGTQSFSDIIVDLEMRTEEVELPQVQPAPGEEFRCHAGIWRAAKALVSPESKLFEKLRVALEENEGFGVIFCGHSLGGAIASAAALLLGEYRVPDGVERDQGSWFTNSSTGLPAHRPIRAISFANPVTMTSELASRAAMGSIPLVTTVVLGSDIIPRAGHGQVRELRRVLGALSRVRRRHGDRVHIVRSYWDWRSIVRTGTGSGEQGQGQEQEQEQEQEQDGVLRHRREQIEAQLWSLRREVESELYAAVRARSEAASRSAALDTRTLTSEAAQGGPLVPAGRCIWIDKDELYLVTSPLAFFSLPDLRADMFATHFPAAYEEAILNLRT